MSDKQILSDAYLDKYKKGEHINIEELFGPYIKATKVRTNVMFTSLDNFKRKLKITSNVFAPMEKVWKKSPNTILAGGKVIDFVLNKSLEESSNDYDIYSLSTFRTINPYKIFGTIDIKDRIKSYRHLTEVITKDNFKYQFMNKLYNEPEELIEEFDFRCCAICTNGKYIWWVKGCLKDIRDKKIIVINPKSVINNFIRIQKYLNKGYSISCVDYNIICINTLQSLLNYNYSNEIHEKERLGPVIFNRDHVYNREDMQYLEEFSAKLCRRNRWPLA